MPFKYVYFVVSMQICGKDTVIFSKKERKIWIFQ